MPTILRRAVLGLIGSAAVSRPMAPAPAAAGATTAFRDEVLAILREHYPDRRFTPGPDDDTILLGPIRFALANLAAHVGDRRGAERRMTIIAWFDQMLAGSPDIPSDKQAESWDYAKPRLRPKIVPVDYLKEAPALVHRGFSARLRLAYGVDQGEADRYVLRNLVEGWRVSDEIVHDQAIANLEAMSAGIGLEPEAPKQGEGLFLAIERRDAYDAARLGVPGFRKRIVEALGPDARAAVPNRDFLLAWSRGFTHERTVIGLVAREFRTQPYPLSDEIFVLEAGGGLHPLDRV